MSRPEKEDVQGYLEAIDAYLQGALEPLDLKDAIVGLWISDRDSPEYRNIDVNLCKTKAKALLADVRKGLLPDGAFGVAWVSLWTHGQPRTHVLRAIAGLLHDYAYWFSPDPRIRESDPGFFIDEQRLRDVMKALRDVLTILTEEQWP